MKLRASAGLEVAFALANETDPARVLENAPGWISDAFGCRCILTSLSGLEAGSVLQDKLRLGAVRVEQVRGASIPLEFSDATYSSMALAAYVGRTGEAELIAVLALEAGELSDEQLHQARLVVGILGNVLRRERVGLDVSDEDSSGARAELGLVREVLRLKNTMLDRSSADLEQFAKALSHDMKEPLRVITCFSDVLRAQLGEELGERGQRYLGFMSDAALRMRWMVHGLLEYSSAEHHAATHARVDLKQAIEGVLAEERDTIARTSAEIVVGEMPVVETDPIDLHRLLLALVSNSLKFHGDRPAHIELRAERHAEGWLIEVADQGIGIAPHFADRIFRMFQRADASRHEGSGIGLAIARRVSHRLGGRIWFESAPGEGATFWFTLPTEPPEAVERAQPPRLDAD